LAIGVIYITSVAFFMRNWFARWWNRAMNEVCSIVSDVFSAMNLGARLPIQSGCLQRQDWWPRCGLGSGLNFEP
jgi:hypothetical protein